MGWLCCRHKCNQLTNLLAHTDCRSKAILRPENKRNMVEITIVVVKLVRLPISLGSKTKMTTRRWSKALRGSWTWNSDTKKCKKKCSQKMFRGRKTPQIKFLACVLFAYLAQLIYKLVGIVWIIHHTAVTAGCKFERSSCTKIGARWALTRYENTK